MEVQSDFLQGLKDGPFYEGFEVFWHPSEFVLEFFREFLLRDQLDIFKNLPQIMKLLLVLQPMVLVVLKCHLFVSLIYELHC